MAEMLKEDSTLSAYEVHSSSLVQVLLNCLSNRVCYNSNNNSNSNRICYNSNNNSNNNSNSNRVCYNNNNNNGNICNCTETFEKGTTSLRRTLSIYMKQ